MQQFLRDKVYQICNKEIRPKYKGRDISSTMADFVLDIIEIYEDEKYKLHHYEV